MMPDAPLALSLVILMVLTGALGGFLSGFLGAGGGFLFVPVLYYVLTVTGAGTEHAMHLAVGTSLCIMVANGAVSAFNHKKRHSVDLDLLKDWGPFTVMGVVLGAGVASSLKSQTLSWVFIVITLLMALYMGFAKSDFDRAQKADKKAETFHPFFFFGLGLLSSLVGIGGAIMSVPFMTWNGIPITRAVGTASALGLLISVPGTIGYIILGSRVADLPPLSLGFISLPAVILIVPSALLLSPYGVRAAHRVKKDTLRKVFALLLLFVSLKMFYGQIGPLHLLHAP